MSTFFAMTIFDSIQNLLEKGCRFFFSEAFFLEDFVKQISTSAQLSNKVEILLILKDFVES